MVSSGHFKFFFNFAKLVQIWHYFVEYAVFEAPFEFSHIELAIYCLFFVAWFYISNFETLITEQKKTSSGVKHFFEFELKTTITFRWFKNIPSKMLSYSPKFAE